jgi:hypothetical protein
MMSLIFFHIALISTTILFAFGLGIWGIEHYLRFHQSIDLWTGIGSFAVSILFAFYLGWFIRNLKKRS